MIDPAFGVNNFGKPKMYNETQTVANTILSILFGKPGSIPSMPELGMYIQGQLFNFFDDINADALKNQLAEQCGYLDVYIQSEEFDIIKETIEHPVTGEKSDILLIVLPTQIEDVSKRFVIGMEKRGDSVVYNFTWLD